MRINIRKEYWEDQKLLDKIQQTTTYNLVFLLIITVFYYIKSLQGWIIIPTILMLLQQGLQWYSYKAYKKQAEEEYNVNE